jgi:hypothetical protein
LQLAYAQGLAEYWLDDFDWRYHGVDEMPRGGHFPPFEEPMLFIDDVRAFFATIR